MISSQKRDKCIIKMLALDKNSMIKSRSETASSELLYGFSKSNKRVVIWRSIGNVVPARAAAPNGDRLVCFILNSNRSVSRVNIL